jgi:glucose-1-phosphate cytidylyltransferase
MTYGDGVSDVDISKLVSFHKTQGLKATVTAVRPSGRFGALATQGNKVLSFREKPLGDNSWINGGFFVLARSVVDYVGGDDTVWEGEPMERLAAEGQLGAYFHDGFWQPMDTLRDKRVLEDQWKKGKALWKRS